MLRHACGFALADQGADTRLIQDYLGHRNIQHTVKYTATTPGTIRKVVEVTQAETRSRPAKRLLPSPPWGCTRRAAIRPNYSLLLWLPGAARQPRRRLI
jgi:Phage integrase family